MAGGLTGSHMAGTRLEEIWMRLFAEKLPVILNLRVTRRKKDISLSLTVNGLQVICCTEGEGEEDIYSD